MSFLVFGINHRRASIELREKLVLSADKNPEILSHWMKQAKLSEAMFLSTCNRSEVYAISEESSFSFQMLSDSFSSHFEVPSAVIEKSFYRYIDQDAILHAFRVASGLDSMVLGEAQILGQLKDAYRIFDELGTIGPQLVRYFQAVFRTAKRVRSETEIARHPVSVGSIAVLLVEKVFGSLKDRKVLVLGAGKMGHLTLRSLVDQQISKIWIANRDLQKAESVANEFGAEALRLSDFKLALPQADLVIVQTASSDYLLKEQDLLDAMQTRKNKPMFLIDLSVPRNIDPRINALFNVYLYDLDDLQTIAKTHTKEKEKEAKKAEVLIEEEILRFQEGLKYSSAVPAIQKLAKKCEEIRLKELEKAFSRLKSLSLTEKEAIEACTQAIVNKILHDPLVALRQDAESSDASKLRLSDWIHRIFGLDEKY